MRTARLLALLLLAVPRGMRPWMIRRAEVTGRSPGPTSTYNAECNDSKAATLRITLQERRQQLLLFA